MTRTTTSWRTTPLPKGWKDKIRPRILERDNRRCTWVEGAEDGGHWSQWGHVDRCTQAATDVDHIGKPDDHSDANLRALCSWHHDRRSSRQANAAAAVKREAQRRPKPRHPGLIE